MVACGLNPSGSGGSGAGRNRSAMCFAALFASLCLTCCCAVWMLRPVRWACRTLLPYLRFTGTLPAAIYSNRGQTFAPALESKFLLDVLKVYGVYIHKTLECF